MRNLRHCAIGLAFSMAACGAPAIEKWSVEAETGRLTLKRAGSQAVWRGEQVAEVGYWDAAGKERLRPVASTAGWTIRREAVPGGYRLVCRQAELGLGFHLSFVVTDDVLTAGMPSASVSETGAARLKNLRLLPRFGAAREGEEGYLVIPHQSGVLCHFRGKKPAEHWLPVYQSIAHCPMPLFGMVRAASGFAAIITSGQYDARLCASVNWGAEQQYAIDPDFALRSFREETRLPDDITVQYHFLPDAQASWLEMAKRYRAYNFTKRGIRPLRQRAATARQLAYSAQAIEVRIRVGVKPMPAKITEQTPETEPPVRVFCDFNRVRDIVNEFHRQGIARAEFCLVGWNRGGHDGRYPQIFPPEPAMGGEPALRATISHARSLGYQMVGHDCYYGAYRISEDWNEEYLRKQPDGQPRKGGIWGGGQSYNICPARAYDLFARRDLPKIRALGFDGVHYSDVLSIFGPRPCYDPRHPETRRQDAEAVVRMLALIRETFGGVQSEGPLDFTAPHLDRLLYIDDTKFNSQLKKPYVDVRVPFYETVYHGVLVYNLSHETLNSQPGEATYLRNIEYGGLPLVCFYGHFIDTPGRNWMGERDYRYDDAAGLKQAVAQIRRVYDDVERLKHLQMEFIDGHRQVSEQVFETRYSNGERVVVNYGDTPYRLPEGGVVPPRGYQLLVGKGAPGASRRGGSRTK